MYVFCTCDSSPINTHTHTLQTFKLVIDTLVFIIFFKLIHYSFVREIYVRLVYERKNISIGNCWIPYVCKIPSDRDRVPR